MNRGLILHDTKYEAQDLLLGASQFIAICIQEEDTCQDSSTFVSVKESVVEGQGPEKGCSLVMHRAVCRHAPILSGGGIRGGLQESLSIAAQPPFTGMLFVAGEDVVDQKMDEKDFASREVLNRPANTWLVPPAGVDSAQ